MWREKCDLCCVTPPSPCRGSAEKPGQAGLGRDGSTAPLYFYPRCSSTPHSTAPSYQTTLGMVLSPLKHHQHQFIQFCNARSIKKLFSEGRYLLVDIIYTIHTVSGGISLLIQGDENKFKLPAQYIALDTLHLFWCGTKRGIFNVNIRKLFKEQQDLDTETACLNGNAM